MSQNLWTHIRTVSDFPKAGIEFYDISPLLNQHLNQLIDALIDALSLGGLCLPAFWLLALIKV